MSGEMIFAIAGVVICVLWLIRFAYIIGYGDGHGDAMWAMGTITSNEAKPNDHKPKDISTAYDTINRDTLNMSDDIHDY